MTDKRTTELTEATTATTDDLLPLLDDPGGTPTLKKITLTNFLSSISSLLTAFTGDSGSGGTKGAVPAPSAGDAAALKFLKSDGTWDAAATPSGTQTLTNKRVTPRVVAVTVSATPAINVDNGDIFTITSQNAAITSMTTNLTGTPTNGQKMMVEILDNGTARAITWGASFASGPGTLPTTTTVNKWLYAGFEYSSSRSKWICLATGSEQ